MKVITISGKAESGKDTTAKAIKNQLNKEGHTVLITHFADLLKFQAKQYFNWNGEKDDYGRSLLQRLGTDFVRVKNENYWVEYIVNMLKIYDSSWDYVLIPDARFENEIELMKKNFNCVSVRIDSKSFESKLSEEQKNHPSETALDNYKFDFIIHNDRTPKGLTTEVNKFLKNVR